MSETLIVAACVEELAGVSGVAIGVGAVDAAAGIAAVLAREPPERVILVGTCGEYTQDDARVGRVVVVERAIWVAGAPGIEVPEVVRRDALADVVACAWLARATGAPRVIAACPAGVTVDDGVAARIQASTGAVVEHLEAFAVLRACELVQVPAVALLAVANRVGRGAREEWRARRVEAEASAIAALKRALASR